MNWWKERGALLERRGGRKFCAWGVGAGQGEDRDSEGARCRLRGAGVSGRERKPLELRDGQEEAVAIILWFV